MRLEIADDCTARDAQFLLEQFELREDDLYRCTGPVNLHRLVALHDARRSPDLKYPAFVPQRRRCSSSRATIFDRCCRGDRLLHHPYESFAPVVEFLRRLARRTRTCSRSSRRSTGSARTRRSSRRCSTPRATARRSPWSSSCARASTRRRTSTSRRGCRRPALKVVYGVVGYKAHAKHPVIVRREGNAPAPLRPPRDRQLPHRTARAYTDFGLLTCDRDDRRGRPQPVQAAHRARPRGAPKKLLAVAVPLQQGLIALIDARPRTRARQAGAHHRRR